MKNKIFLLIFIISCSGADQSTSTSNEQSKNLIIDKTENAIEPGFYLNEINIPISDDLHFNSLENCIDFIGSLHKVDCLNSYEIFRIIEFESVVVNTFKTEKFLYVVLKDGIIFEFEYADNNLREIFRINDIENIQEAGLLSIALNDEGNEFAISYLNKQFELVVDKYSYTEDIAKHTFVSQIFSQQMNKPYIHISGNLIWSKYYKTYLLSVGDNQEANAISRINPTPLNTTSQLGKILALENVEIDVPLIFSGNKGTQLSNIIVYGLRNPWQFFEYSGNLVVFDVGLSIHEEMTISKLSDHAKSFGWPIFEGGSKSEAIDSIENYSIDITYNLDDYNLNSEESMNKLKSEAISPSFFYSHYPTENDYRGAIIGGDIILGKNNSYSLNIVSVDIATNELFLYSIADNSVKIVPPPSTNRETITNIRSLNNNFADLVVGTYEGKLIFINLP